MQMYEAIDLLNVSLGLF